MNEAFDCLTQLEQQQNPKISLTSQAPSHFDCSQQSIDRTAQNEMCAEYYAALTAQPNTTSGRYKRRYILLLFDERREDETSVENTSCREGNGVKEREGRGSYQIRVQLLFFNTCNFPSSLSLSLYCVWVPLLLLFNCQATRVQSTKTVSLFVILKPGISESITRLSINKRKQEESVTTSR